MPNLFRKVSLKRDISLTANTNNFTSGTIPTRIIGPERGQRSRENPLVSILPTYLKERHHSGAQLTDDCQVPKPAAQLRLKSFRERLLNCCHQRVNGKH